jgi:hypothetical protein
MCRYNSNGNGPVAITPAVQPPYTKAEVVPDNALLAKGCIPLDPSRADFLGGEESVETIQKNPILHDKEEF